MNPPVDAGSGPDRPADDCLLGQPVAAHRQPAETFRPARRRSAQLPTRWRPRSVSIARMTGLLMRVLAGLGLLEFRDGAFANSAAASAFLVSTSPAYMGNAMRYSDQLYATWGSLDEALRSGKPALAAESYLGDDKARTRTFVHAMHGRAMGIARVLVEVLDLKGRKAMLDVGGGPGTYSILLTERNPGLRSEVLELPGVAAVAREIVAAAGASERVSLRDGDYHSSDFGSGHDVVLMSGMFHRENESSCRRLIEKARACLVPGGLLIVSDVFSDEGGCTPPFAALFGLNMALTAPDGTVHADARRRRVDAGRRLHVDRRRARCRRRCRIGW